MRLFVPLWHPPEPVPAGGTYRTRRLLEEMRDFRVVVADSDSSDIDPKRVSGELIFYRTKWIYAASPPWFQIMRAANYAASCIAMIAIGLRAGKIDAVYVPTSELPHTALAGFVVGKMKRVPIVFANLNVRGTILWPLNKRLHNAVDRIIALSHALREELIAEGIGTQIDIGTVGVDDYSVPPSPAPSFDAVFVGRHTVEKGIFDLIDAWSLCCSERPELRLLTLGACTESVRDQLRTRIRQLGLQRNITLGGVVDERAKWNAYAQSRLCVFPSHVEGWGIVPIEAYLAGREVVAYDLGAYAETIKGSDGATLVPRGDVAAFAAAVLRRLDAPSTNAEALRRWAARFTWAAAAEVEEGVLREVVPV